MEKSELEIIEEMDRFPTYELEYFNLELETTADSLFD